ncbi:MAG: hypothetical protein JWQ97_1999, partial [Phenylobacterium sp.]|nr:hypothetical protein [Phenylobacterium sp.]
MLASTSAPASLAEEAGEALRNAAHPNVLRVVVSGVSSAAGDVRVDVCTRSEFLHDCRYSASAPATPSVTVVIVKDLPPGVYAIQAYHDRNDNYSVDQNFLGVP